MEKLKKIWRFLSSMKFALILLFILVGACTAGSLIPQQETTNYYLSHYPELVTKGILALGLDDVFHCGWFVVLTVFLCLNLLLCNILRFPQLMQRTRKAYTAEKCLAQWDGTPVLVLETPEPLFQSMGFRRVQSAEQQGAPCLYACKNKAGLWGAWLCHLGMLVVILGFALGQMLRQEYTVYGVPGQTKPVGDTGFELTIEAFEIRLREDDTVEQYESRLAMTRTSTGETVRGSAMVNAPLSCFGWKLYQNSTGWAATIEVFRGEELVQKELLCAGEYLSVHGLEDLVVLFRAFYPDYALDASGTPVTRSSRLENPAYVYMLYYKDAFLGMNVLSGNECITVDDYSIRFQEPQSYTLIQVKQDSFEWVVAAGALLVIGGLLLAFYCYPAELWAVRRSDGRWAVAGKSAKAGRVYRDTLEEKGRRFVEQNVQ